MASPSAQPATHVLPGLATPRAAARTTYIRSERSTLRNYGIALITFAGLDIDAVFQVRREDGSLVANLDAVGDVIGAAAACGQSFCSGMLLTPAITFGRLLRRRLGQVASAASACPS